MRKELFLEVSSFTLGGPVKVNLAALEALATEAGNDYLLFADSNGAFDSAVAADFTILAPTCYACEASSVETAGTAVSTTRVDRSTGRHPEPSTCARIGLDLWRWLVFASVVKLSA